MNVPATGPRVLGGLWRWVMRVHWSVLFSARKAPLPRHATPRSAGSRDRTTEQPEHVNMAGATDDGKSVFALFGSLTVCHYAFPRAPCQPARTSRACARRWAMPPRPQSNVLRSPAQSQPLLRRQKCLYAKCKLTARVRQLSAKRTTLSTSALPSVQSRRARLRPL